MNRKNINFEDKKKKSKFCKNKKVFLLDDIDVIKIVSKKEPYGIWL